MWIRSQDKTKLLQANKVRVVPNNEYIAEILKIDTEYDIMCDDYIIGTYSTEEKALKVLDMIQSTLTNYKLLLSSEYGQYKTPAEKLSILPTLCIFEMPKDEEVKV